MRDFHNIDGDRVALNAIRDISLLAFGEVGTRMSKKRQSAVTASVLRQSYEDIAAYHARDPGVRGRDMLCLISPYSTFFAVLCYRLSHQLAIYEREMETAFHLHYFARSKTGVEIHPEARIGNRFIIDHGWGTVIGQTAEIGDDCYILNNVTLGGRSVANAPSGKRHPVIGDRVQISGRAKIFGPVSIGDDCFIGPDTEVTKNIPAGMKVLTANKDLTIEPRSKIYRDPGYV